LSACMMSYGYELWVMNYGLWVVLNFKF
jgi:hypothetical protein